MKNRKTLPLTHLPVTSDNVALQYTGFFSQTNIAAMAEVIRLYLEQNETSGSRRRRLFSTFIEMVQNILRYSADKRALVHSEDKWRFGSVTLSQQNGRYVCESINLIRNEDSSRLQQCLENLARMSHDEIKHYYKSSLRAESPEWSKGANIGLLTLARDVSEPLEFTFASVESTAHSTFYLKAII